MAVRSKSQKVKKSKGGRHQLSVISKEANLQWEELNVIGACRHNDYTPGMPRSADNLLRNDNREYAIKKYLEHVTNSFRCHCEDPATAGDVAIQGYVGHGVFGKGMSVFTLDTR